MKDYLASATTLTPGISLKYSTHHLKFEGNSFPDNAEFLYEPVINWIHEYQSHLRELKQNEKEDEIQIVLDFMFRYVNSSTHLKLRDILKLLIDITKELENIKLMCSWHYLEEDPDMRVLGEELESFFDHPIQYVIMED